MTHRVASLAFLGVAVWAIAASLYAYRARDNSIRGWNHSIAGTAGRDQLKGKDTALRVAREAGWTGSVHA